MRGGPNDPIDVIDLSDDRLEQAPGSPHRAGDRSGPGLRPQHRLPLTVAALLAVVLLGDVSRIAIHSGGARLASQAVATKARTLPDETPSVVPSVSSPIPVPAQTGLSQPLTELMPTPAPLPSLGLVLPGGPALTGVADVKMDLALRMVVLNDDIVLADTTAQGSGFQTPAQEIALLPAARQALNRASLTAEGLQGAYSSEWIDVRSQQAIVVTLLRFATAAGAQTHLEHLSSGPAGSEGRLHPVTTALPRSFAFAGKTASGEHDEHLVYFESGRYFGLVEVQGQPGDTTISKVVNEVATAQVADCT